MKVKYRVIWERGFFVNLQAGISQLYYRLTSSHIVFSDFKEMKAFEWLLLVLV